MAKIALILRQKQSSWVSCQSITRNLVEAYQVAFPDAEGHELRIFDPGSKVDLYQAYLTSERIRSFSPDFISIVDHEPHPGTLLNFLLNKPTLKNTRVVVHVFGDFILQSQAWNQARIALAQFNTVFLCASHKQTALIRSLIETGESVAFTLPFPVRATDFYFSKNLRDTFRGHLGIKDSDRVFLYTGRLSQQKNILLLTKIFGLFMSNSRVQAKLWLAGPVDDLGYPYLGQASGHGSQQSGLINLIKNILPDEAAKMVRYLGDLDKRDLVKYYNAADFFVSLSTHNDEDFGMSPAEAMLCGLPLILTDWGGYSSFHKISPTTCRLLPITMTEKRIVPDSQSFIRAIDDYHALYQSDAGREKVALSAFNTLSCESVALQLRQRLGGLNSVGFTHFTDRFDKICRAFRLNPQAPFANESVFSSLYRDIYEPYF